MQIEESKPNYTQSEPKEDPSNQFEDLSRILNQKDQRHPKSELVDILTKAQQLKEFEEKRQSILSQLSEQEKLESTLPLSWLYDTAEKMGLSLYAQRILDSQYPSIEQQKADLAKHNASTSFKMKLGEIRTYMAEIKKSLEDSFIGYKILFKDKKSFAYDLSYDLCNRTNRKFVFGLIEEREKQGIFGKKKVKRINKNLAAIIAYCGSYYDSYGLNIEVYDPRFLHICDKNIEKLKKVSPKVIDRIRLNTHYH